MVAALCLVFRCKLLISCRHFSYVWLSFWWLSSLPVGSYGFIEACVLFWQSCKKKKRCWEIEVGNMNPKNNNMKCSTADWPIVNLTAGAPRCVYITFRLSGCSRSLTKKRQKIVACFLGCLLKTPAWPLTWLFSYTQHTYTPTYVGGLCVCVSLCKRSSLPPKLAAFCRLQALVTLHIN